MRIGLTAKIPENSITLTKTELFFGRMKSS